MKAHIQVWVIIQFLHSDLLGDTIVIPYNNGLYPTRAIHVNGKTVDRNGHPVNFSRDFTPFAAKVSNDLIKIKNLNDPVLTDRLTNMEKSSNFHFIIQSYDGDNHNDAISISDDKANIPTGSFTQYNPDNYFSPNGEPRDPIIALTHEFLGHGYDTDKGQSKDGERTSNGIKLNEVSAINIENRTRAQLGAPLRTTNSGLEIPKEYLTLPKK